MGFIEVEHLTKRFGSQCALSDISLSIEEGEIFGIIGLSGAGKSTLIRCLSTLEKPSSGQIWIDGENVTQLEERALYPVRRKMGMIFQHFNLFSSRTALENVAYPLEILDMPKEERWTRAAEMLDLVGLKHKESAYPARLSGGEKQRVGIARALVGHPKVLFCDEATSALDPKTTKEILALLKDLHSRLRFTIVLITHEMEVVRQICNTVAVLDQGQIVECGAILTLCSDPKHSITKSFLQNATHEIPIHFFKEHARNRKLLRLRFTGASASEPIISAMVRKYAVDVNILLGWIDNIQKAMIGTLVIELTGPEEDMEGSLVYLEEKSVHVEILQK